MFQLRMLGGLWLERDDRTIAEVRGRALGLLGVIAAAAGRRATRDQILGVLWPEVDQERGSHSLSQTLYSLRRQLGTEPTVAEGAMLRLDDSKVVTDLTEFERAVAASDWAAAARLYRGPFLAGFYLEGAPDFERWATEVRERLARDGERAIEQYAERCDRGGEASEARTAWSRLAELDPLNSRYGYQYILALAKSGDRGGAVRHGLAHVARLKAELNSAPPTRLAELLERLQRGTFVSTQREGGTPPS
jgi:DNA-binding SARP family transcriptional activator